MAKTNFLAEAMKETTDLKNLMKSNVEKTMLEHLQPRINQLVSRNLQEMGDSVRSFFVENLIEIAFIFYYIVKYFAS